MNPAPLPPAALRGRVGRFEDEEFYDAVGQASRDSLLGALPAGWAFEGKRVLDFGAGAGRTLRWLRDQARSCESFSACDIDAASTEWLGQAMPEFHAFTNDESPPLPIDSSSLDLVYAFSVFTHLEESWSSWLVELHRVLKPDGLLFATFLGDGTWTLGAAGQAGVPYDERIGMHAEGPWRDFVRHHGPAVFLSEWWLREHWGRAFEILALETSGAAPARGHSGQGWALMRPRPVELQPEDLERPGDDPRELAAAIQSVRLTRREYGEQMAGILAQLDTASAERDALRAERDSALADLAAVQSSSLMRATTPLRRAWYRLRR